ncbi:CBS and ACT domain-containing protein [Brevibacillus brevis]|uniref:Acetoin utilization protein AcuB n=1 Tax=Brevibacillus brevis (strain 47 / JCM 6285 / NBRC 100599) TaxID=358681 RepID=C0ZHL4_BREBN|nr:MULTISPECIES: CBS and ACT domain-containing protein [Brevibacillus]MBH0330797.1 acetoin utilization protein AcuB [Brevibacillus brevis]NRR05363.1 CBS domain-containing protein [Brevibacillus sp. RS1.1]NRS49188.1 CBS domain-containing protein [Brevibacillus sp. HB2.2]UIO41015.1 CBS and ACT domain-containing protein [Brevibacillus brevis]WGV58534.1 CBS and ACT domain-containing protein [Brevibacillus brevis]
MRIEEIMRKKMVTIQPSTTIGEALLLLRANRIRHLPVIENDSLVGIVSDRDLRDALPSRLLTHDDDDTVLHKPVADIMNQQVITAHPLDFIEDAALQLYEHKIGSLPIVEGNRLVGLITESDLFSSLIELFGVNKPSSHIEVEVDDRVGMLAEVSQVFRDAQVNVTSVVVFPGKKPAKKNLVFRVQTIDPRIVTQLLLEKGFSVIGPTEGGIPQ